MKRLAKGQDLSWIFYPPQPFSECIIYATTAWSEVHSRCMMRTPQLITY